jgi:hypothetical protein
MNAVENLHKKASIWYEQIAGIISLSQKLGKPAPDLSSYYGQITKIFEEELELSRLADCSDLIFHAEGPSAQSQSFKLNAVTNLFEGVDRQIKQLAQSVLKLGMDDVRPAMKYLDIRLNGITTGSIFAGFSIKPFDSSTLIGTDEEIDLMRSIKNVVIDLAQIPQFLTDDGISEELTDIFSDPAVRDSSLMAAYKLSPSGKLGINSIEIINPKISNRVPATLGIRERSILRNSLNKNPVIKTKSTYGTFIGQLRTVDLDKTRVDLRDIQAEGIDTLRCILPQLTAEKGREILGKTVEVSGEYEKLPNGKPRLMLIESIKVMESAPLDLH